MICKVCGREIKNEEAHFCEYCGTSVDGRDAGYQAAGYTGTRDQSAGNGFGSDRPDAYRAAGNNRPNGYGTGDSSGAGQAGMYGRMNAGAAAGQPAAQQTGGLTGILLGTAGTAQAEPSMSFLHWMVILLLPYIPMLGGFIYLILMLIWAFGKTASRTRKNWARASLLITLISAVIMTYSLGNMAADGSLAELLNGLGLS